jgi:bifunctional non-homologous end joining protein LigD
LITHSDRVLFPDDGITKGDLAAYYEVMAPVILPHMRGRPVTMERYPAGIGEKGFWQKDVSTQHVWTSRMPDLNYPDICVFDLDPSNESSPEPGLRGDGIDEMRRVRDWSPLVVHQRRRTRFE